MLQIPLNQTLHQEIASGYVSYEYSTMPGVVPGVAADADRRS